MQNLRIFVMCVGLVISAFTLKAQGPVPNIADIRLDFTVAGLKGDSITLSSLKGKVLILDFWASWCGPCRFSNKHLVKMYSKYRDKGLEILSVSLDDELKDWKKAVAKDKITWLQGIDLGGWDALAAIKWQVDALPASFVVNKNGDVVAINPEKDELEKKIRELLGL
ncbi:MAG TPA: TlpA disulfide reductase family protein [Chitinophagaceae bacterium]|nr:TlpA disulfide reductase family protein [Chitinophagaceae bacterium]